MEKSPEAYRTIREVAEALDLPQHVLRFWETRFPQIRPLKRAGGRRYYRPDDIERLRLIRRLLYDDGYTIKGVQRLFKEQGVQALAGGPGFDQRVSPEPGAAVEPADDAPRKVEAVAAATPKLGEDELAALRRALAEIRDAERILQHARSQGS